MDNESRKGTGEPGPDRLLDAREAAAFLRVKLDTLYRWVQRRKLRAVRIGRTLRFRQRTLEQFVLDHEDGRR